jgi:hypothetical protein
VGVLGDIPQFNTKHFKNILSFNIEVISRALTREYRLMRRTEKGAFTKLKNISYFNQIGILFDA